MGYPRVGAAGRLGIRERVSVGRRCAFHGSIHLYTRAHSRPQAHAMSPQQASGGGQAIEVSPSPTLSYSFLYLSIEQDAYLLATLLGHHLTTKSTLARALSIYDSIRRPVANEVARRSLVNGSLFGLQLPDVQSSPSPSSSSSSVPSVLGLKPSPTGPTTPIDFSLPVDFSKIVDFTKKENQGRLEENGRAIKENWRWTWETSVEGDVERAVSELEGWEEVVGEVRARL